MSQTHKAAAIAKLPIDEAIAEVAQMDPAEALAAIALLPHAQQTAVLTGLHREHGGGCAAVAVATRLLCFLPGARVEAAGT
jgi:hypothetical protein